MEASTRAPAASASPPIERMFSERPNGRKSAITIRMVSGAVTIGNQRGGEISEEEEDHHRHRDHDFEQGIP